MLRIQIVLLVLALRSIVVGAAGVCLVSPESPGAFPVVESGQVAVIVVDPGESEVVRVVAAPALARDIERVTSRSPRVAQSRQLEQPGPTIVIGTLGESGPVDELVRRGLIDASDLVGRWESFAITAVDRSGGREPDTLVVVGSDRRGTAFGAFEVSRAIGVSPWSWWADVPVQHRDELRLATDGDRVGPPSVRYRGVFLNDEDWGLQPWAAKTFEPETGDIGPKTYAAIFELLLRLRANFIWPAMHPSTHAFNFYPDNKLVADRYAIVMGSSHAEPMLRDNVDEWKRDGSGEWNFVTNRDAIVRYWEDRVRSNGMYENVYTIGMRGIHDSGMTGGGSLETQARRLEEIFAVQRDMLERHTGRPASEIPQAFIPYKEVLDIYRAGVDVPDDVTLVWIDDNHGYIRQLSNADERGRSGRGGVYYHISYWGRPHDYLWLESTPPGLIWEEMTKAAEFGADRVWVVNVGDLKPAEFGMDWFLRLAWDVDRYGPGEVREGMEVFYGECFGPEHASRIAAVMSEFYRLNFARKPEHMGWSTVYPNTPVQDSELSHRAHGDEAERRLADFAAIEAEAEASEDELGQEYRDAYFQLVLYPIRGAADMNRKIIHAEESRSLAALGLPAANEHAHLAAEAFQRIVTNTARYNRAIAGGKWDGMMTMDPRQLPVFGMPPVGEVQALGPPGLAVLVEGKARPARPDGAAAAVSGETPTTIEFSADEARATDPLRRIEIDGRSVLEWPQGKEHRKQTADGAARAAFGFEIGWGGRCTVRLEVNHATPDDDSWYIVIDGGEPVTWNDHSTDGRWEWFDALNVTLAPGPHAIELVAREDGAQLRAVQVVPEGAGSAVVPAMYDDTNTLPAINRYTRRSVFIDLYNTGGGRVAWSAEADEPWLRIDHASGRFAAHQRLRVSVDFDRMPRHGRLSAAIQVRDGEKAYTLSLPVDNPDANIPAGGFVRENGWISIDAEDFDAGLSHNVPERRWEVINEVGYSGAAVGLLPRLLPEDAEKEAREHPPTLAYRLYTEVAAAAELILQALPTHEITKDHRLACAVSMNGGPPIELQFVQGNDENDSTWQRNVLRGAMTATTPVELTAGENILTVYGIDASVVLDRIMVRFDDALPTYLGPRSTRVGGSAGERSETSVLPARPPRFVLVGDSTVTDDVGWGAGFRGCLTREATCVNTAAKGRNSKSFRDEGLWDKRVVPCQPDTVDGRPGSPVYVLIQFGHNGQPGKGPERETDPATSYRDNLRRCVDESRAMGMTPILVTPMTRRRFADDGRITTTLTPWAEAARAIGDELDVPVIDLHTISLHLFEHLGLDGCLPLEPVGKSRDATHLNAEGSQLVGAVVAAE
ncbi:MAG: glycosyl hydrolase 115 family protein [Phycisphaeraceae bacterium]|nr:MAG: glycosyl hydrolase 115 family protein [Phycisphaeraceae bacterium]